MFQVSVENSRSMGVKEVLYESLFEGGILGGGSVEISNMVAMHGNLCIDENIDFIIRTDIIKKGGLI